MIGTVQPDLVLADVHMPGLTGYEVCEKIRQKPEFSDLPVILLVGSFEPFDEAEAARVGASDFLTKPFQSIRQLIEKVGSLLDAPKTDGQNATATTATTDAANDAGQVSDEEFLAEVETAPLAAADLNFLDAVDGDETPTAKLNETNDKEVFGEEVDDETIEIMSGDQIAANQSAESEQLIDQVSADDSFENRTTAPLLFSDTEVANESFASAQIPTETIEAEPLQTPTANFDANAAQPIFPESDDEPFGELPASARAIENASDQNFDTISFDTISTENMNQTVDFGGAESNAAPAPTPDFSAFEIDFDDDSLLELDEEKRGPANPPPPKTPGGPRSKPRPPKTGGDALMRSETAAAETQNLTFSPEMIDAIAQRVVEKLSDKVIEKIAWEIVPDRFDLIVRKHIDGRER